MVELIKVDSNNIWKIIKLSLLEVLHYHLEFTEEIL